MDIVIVKVAGTEEIVGTDMKTNDSSIFSLKNGNIQNPIPNRVRNKNRALYYPNDQNIYGPFFLMILNLR
ncbi:hypothetical protein Glove_87g54 [Diversispora epigaea]|uniref:Uncharacterized protein n=1 Tax=Diversispora epigaea TaxID=1348612 RepID=A0A397J8P6_9GLOM|nr:hypothetical protein Glove_87g54 [Diversispora epigaea]